MFTQAIRFQGVLFLGLLATLGADSDDPPRQPLKDVRLQVIEPGNAQGEIDRVITINDEGVARLAPEAPFALTFGKNFRITLDLERDRPEHPLDVRVDWNTTGEQDPERRFRVVLRALDADGQEIARTWRTATDNRIGPVEVQLGSRKGIRSTMNSERLEVPAWAFSRLKTIAIELQSKRNSELKHVAPEPSEINLSMTEPDAEGRFELLFTNPNHGQPDAWKLNSKEHQAVVTLRPAEPGQPTRVFVDAREDGMYRVPLQVDPRALDNANVYVVFLTRQVDHEGFVKAFFEQGKGGGYSGMWHQSGGPLVEVPFEKLTPR